MKIEEVSNLQLITHLSSREKQRLQKLKECKFEHWEKIGNKHYLISVDNGAVGTQVRLERYKRKSDYDFCDYEAVIGIYDSIDDAVIELDKLRREEQQ